MYILICNLYLCSIKVLSLSLSLSIIVYPIKTIKRYDSLPTTAAKYTHARNVLTVTKRVERSRSIVIIKHKYMLMCNHKIHINLMRGLRNSTARREISQWVEYTANCRQDSTSRNRFCVKINVKDERIRL